MSDDGLFPEPAREYPFGPLEKVTADRRRTMAQRARISIGRHPVAGTPLHPDAPRVFYPHQEGDGPRCGNCANLMPGEYLKCRLIPLTHGPGTDVRRWWPACTQWEPQPPGKGPDQPEGERA